MSNRRGRGRGSTAYSVRLQRAKVRPPRRPAAAPGRTPAAHPAPAARRLVLGAWLAVSLAVLAELGHLGTAYVEWPDSAARGGYHVVAGALLGLIAAVVLPDPGRAGGQLVARAGAMAGAVVAAAGPVLWLAGGLLGAPPYADLPVPAAAGLAAGELLLAAALLGAWWVARR